jgi:hypothetical protein
VAPASAPAPTNFAVEEFVIPEEAFAAEQELAAKHERDREYIRKHGGQARLAEGYISEGFGTWEPLYEMGFDGPCKRARHRRLLIIAISLLIALALIVTGIYLWSDSVEATRAMADCRNSRVLYDAAHSDYDQAHDLVEEMGNISSDEVTDASTVTELSRLLNQTITTPMECTSETGVESLYATTEQLDQSTLFLEKGMKELSRQARLVETSREEKIFRDSVDHAERLLVNLEGTGNSSNALETLRNEISKDETLLDREETADFMVLQSAESKLESAMNAVADSLKS